MQSFPLPGKQLQVEGNQKKPPPSAKQSTQGQILQHRPLSATKTPTNEGADSQRKKTKSRSKKQQRNATSQNMQTVTNKPNLPLSSLAQNTVSDQHATVDDKIPHLLQSANRFRIAAPIQNQNLDVSGRYWNQISNQMNLDRQAIKEKLAQRQNLASTSQLLKYDGMSSLTTPQHAAGSGDLKSDRPETGGGTHMIQRQNSYQRFIHEADNQINNRPFSFLANVGGKVTTQAMFISPSIEAQVMAQSLNCIEDYVTFSQLSPKLTTLSQQQQQQLHQQQMKQQQQLLYSDRSSVRLRQSSNQENQPKNEQITIFTQMDVDKHDFGIRERRILNRATSAHPKSTNRSQRINIPASTTQLQQQIQMIQQQHVQQQRPISSINPQTLSQKMLQQSKKEQKDFKISKRPFSANPKFMQIAGLSRPISAQVQIGDNQRTKVNVQSDMSSAEDEDEYIDINIQEQSNEEEKQHEQPIDNLESFTQGMKIFASRPTTAYKKDKNFELPFPELFDRSERTYAATFAKYGDLSYYTPVQRIGAYMDFGARLKRSHLMDLIAYTKTSKQTIKAKEEEDSGMDAFDYEESCLFIGVMQDETHTPLSKDPDMRQVQLDKEAELALDRVFDHYAYKFEGTFEYQKVWSELLMKQVQSSIQRYAHYVENQDSIKNEEISKYKKEWMSHALDLIPDHLVQTYNAQLRKLFQEVFMSYSKSMKQAILSYILRSPDERKRLHILMLPRSVPNSADRLILQHGYSTAKYSGQHKRKVEADQEIKLRLLNNNIVVSSLLNWWREFSHTSLVEFKGISKYAQQLGGGNMGDHSCYAIDFQSFINFEDAYRQKVIQFMRYVWYRGTILIIKKFKYFKVKAMLPANQNDGRWQFAGYNSQPKNMDEEQPIENHKQEQIDQLRYADHMSALQKYYLRTGSVHQTSHLQQFAMDEGHDHCSIPEDYADQIGLEDLLDIRENSAYIAFVSMIGGYINFDENGYDILAKEYQRELKYSACALMRQQLRDMVDKAVDKLKNFFRGFPTLDKLKQAVGSEKLRQLRPLITRAQTKHSSIVAERLKKKQDEENLSKKENKLQAQLQKKKEENRRRQQQEDEKNLVIEEFDKEPILNIPDFIDYQDFVNPVFHLELVLRHNQNNQSMMADTLQFDREDKDIIEEFEVYFYKLIGSFNDFMRPEFSKIDIINPKRYAEDLEEERRQAKLNFQIKKSTKVISPQKSSNHSFMAPLGMQGQQSSSKMNVSHTSTHMTGGGGAAGSYHAQPIADFESILYRGHEDSTNMFKKLHGRIQLQESKKDQKDLIDENNLGVYSRPYIQKYMKIAEPEEECYQRVKSSIIKSLQRHLTDAKRVYELYNQFNDIISGTMHQRVKDFIKEDRREREYEQIIKELRFYQNISNQLPSLVFFPMFEVGTGLIKQEIQKRLLFLISQVFNKFESTLYNRCQTIDDKYNQICKYLDKILRTPSDVLDMDRYKNNLLLEISNLQEKMFENRKSMFFLMHQNKMYEDETWALIVALHEWPRKLNNHMDLTEERHRNERADIEMHVIKKRKNFEAVTEGLEETIQEVASWGDLPLYKVVIEKINEYQRQVEAYEDEMQEIGQEEMMLFGIKSSFEAFYNLKKFFIPFFELWTSVTEVMTKKRLWMESPLHEVDPEEVDGMLAQSVKILGRLQKHLGDKASAARVLNTLAQEITELNEWLPTIEVLCNPTLKPRHWVEIQEVAKANFNYKEISLTAIKYYNIKENLAQLAEISEKAKKENRLEKMLDKMENEWKDLKFELTTFRDTGILILQGQNIEEIQLLLDEHTINAQTIRNSPDVLPMEERAIAWERLMVFLQEVIEVWIKVQANYLYLEPIFHSEDIVKKLPNEANEFVKIDKIWRDLMINVQQDTLVLHLPRVKNIQENLNQSNNILDRIQKSLSDYLETKRQYFPRFYFLSNEDLLDILGDSKKPQKVQRHLKKCFEGIDQVVFKGIAQNRPTTTDTQEQEGGDEEIIAMVSREGERVNLVGSIYPHEYKGNVEQWLLELERQMKMSVQNVISQSIIDMHKTSDRAMWIKNWQGQVVLAVSQINWTHHIEQAIKHDGVFGLKEYFKKTQVQLDEIVNLVRKDLSNLMRMTLGSLIVIDVHAKDVLESLIAENTTSIDSFSWLSQLRYYFVTEEKHVIVKMITTIQDYGYEYLGNTTRLVITPLTDRCYRTLMGALHLNLGGAPEGPAGTGKTESTKDLAKAIAVHCMVFNCAEGLNAQAMAKFFKGLASAGSWSCFDEFNRIDLEVLSVVAQQILDIQRAKNQQKEIFHFDDIDINLKKSCNIFITMNPGYAGRSELPDNLKALFRPVAMMIPDYCMIAEISLYSFGFIESRNLAKKIVATYKLCSEQLSSQNHYDYGMRAVKAVLTAAKTLKRKFVNEREDILTLRSINDVNLPKFLAQDIPLFQGITEDLFQGIVLPDVTYGALETALYASLQELKLQKVKSIINKAFQLYETINCRHGLMLVGPTYGGKTCTYRALAKAITLASKQDQSLNELPVDYYVINPKSITLQQLYGSFDPISHDFTDGILAQIFRKCAYVNVGKSRRWIVFDGPVDAEWIENMNTVLDDNKKLCLMNGEVIMMNDQMNLIFETHDLSQASPATVSRCGMVYLEPESIGWQPLLQSWIEGILIKTQGSHKEQMDPFLIKRMEDLFEIFYSESHVFLKKKCKTYVPVSDVQLAAELMKIFQCFLIDPRFLAFCYNPKIKQEDIANRIDMYFLYSLVWSVGAISDEQGQKAFSYHLRKICNDVYKLKGNKTLKIDKNSQIQDGGQNVQNYYIDENRWVSWKDILDKNDTTSFDSTLTYHELIVPTTENLKQSYVLNMCVKNSLPVLFIGPTGTGKSVSITKYIRSLSYDAFSSIFICFSSKSSANQTQEIIDGKLEKRGRRVIGAPFGKKCVIFVDDLNMPQLEKYGAQPPIELLRQWMDHKGWYDYKEKEKQFKELIDIVFVAAMGPPGGGKNPVTPRYLRHFNIIAINNFDETVLLKIFNKLMDWHIRKYGFGGDTQRCLMGVVAGSVDVFLFAQQELRPTPAKSHYLFNLRDLSRIIQGIQMVRKEDLQDGRKVLRLWVHEIGRVINDRLINEGDQNLLYQQLFKSVRDKVKDDLNNAFKAVIDEKKYSYQNKDIMTKHLQFGDVLTDGVSAHDRHYDEISQKQLLSDRMNGFLEDYNSVSKRPMNLVLFDFAILHVLRICRILRMARGNAFLIGVGGSGRQSLSKLSTFICDFDMVEIEQSKSYNKEQWNEDMKRLLMLAGQELKHSVFMLSDAQLKFSFMLEDINNILNSGEIPNLFATEEKLAIVEKLRPTARKEGRLDLYNNGTIEQFQDYFIEKTKSHLHIVLAMSPIGSQLRERIRNFPSLVNCCTIDWFTKWPEDALEAVAGRFLAECDLEAETPKVIQMCKQIHTTATLQSDAYLLEQKRYNYVTPTTYLELIITYKELLRKQRAKILSLKLGYDKGIEKLLFTADEVLKMQVDLNEKQPKLELMTIETEALMDRIQKESREIVEPKKIQIQEEEAIANQMEQEAKTIKIECDNDLSKALPLVKKAEEALHTIKSADIIEIRSLGKPPTAIRTVLHAVCIMGGRKVEKTPKPNNPKELEENWWLTAQKFMSQSDFIDQLLQYDKDNISEAIMFKIRDKFLNDPDFKPSRVEKASQAAKGLCMWVRAMDQYDKVAKLVAPKKARARDAELKYKDTVNGLKKKQAELREIIDQFERLQAQFDASAHKKQVLQENINDCKIKLDRAQQLLFGLGGEQKRWEDTSVQLDKLYKNLNGDILISAAIISYMGAFTSVYRNQIIKQWLYELSSHDISSTNNFSLMSSLGEPVTARKWNLNGLPTDSFSIDNGIIVFNSRRWPLMIDPQAQANKWIKNLEGATGKLKIVKLSDSDFVRSFEQSIQLGIPILLENVGEDIDPILEPVLLKQTFKSAGVMSINFGDQIIEYSNDFRLYITTKYQNPHYLPEISTKVTLINFMITFEGLRDQLLNLVVQKENANLDEERQKLIVQSYENKKILKDVENRILEILRTAQGNILDDEQAINVLNQSQDISKDISEKQLVAEATEEKLEEARKLYNPIAYHSSLLFFIISKLSNIDVMYQYSLTWYIQLFTMAIENSEHSDFIEQRLESLKNYFTYSLYANVCRSLFEKHKLLFSFILTSKIQESIKEISSAQYEFLISILTGLENDSGQDNPVEEWLPTNTWNKMCDLVKIDPARFNKITDKFKENEKEWRKIYESSFPHKEKFPPLGKEQAFTEFEKMCLIKVLRPDKLIVCVKQYVVGVMGETFVNPPPFDLERSYNDSTTTTPLIFVLPGSDPLQSLSAFAQTKRRLDTMKSISLGQNQGAKAEKAIDEARKAGHWVLLQNCHLYPSWMPRLERICEQLELKAGTKEAPHASFRLWLTSYPSASFPVLILQNGIKMTNEPPKGLKANMLGSYKLEPISDQQFMDLHPKAAQFKKVVYGLCMFHAIIQERRNYGSLGWNIRYEFTVSDLQISIQQLHAFMKQYAEIPFTALSYLTGECNYGGRVTDDRDRRVLKSLLSDFYDNKILAEPFYACGLKDFLIPEGNLHIQKYIESIQKMPLEEPPSLFGFHPNANITKELKETDDICYDLLKMGEIDGVKQQAQSAADQKRKLQKHNTQDREKSSVQTASKQELFIEKTCKDILAKLPAKFDIEQVQGKYPVKRENSMNTVLVQELARFNKLLKTIKKSLQTILLALKGDVLMSEQLEKVYGSLLIGEIPQLWLKVSYPSLKPVASYIKDFVNRLQTFQKWVAEGPPNIFWISGFFFTQSFLTGTLQNYARRYKFEIDTLAFDFEFLDEDPTDYENEIYTNERTKHKTPNDGALISGLYLEGAAWDHKEGVLCESQAKILYTRVPIIWLKPTRQSKLREDSIYDCPTYKTAERKGVLSTTGHSTNYILNIRVPSNQPEAHWVKRGVAMLSQLST